MIIITLKPICHGSAVPSGTLEHTRQYVALTNPLHRHEDCLCPVCMCVAFILRLVGLCDSDALYFRDPPCDVGQREV
jgi:hypothetical protein